jgi:3',5'-cyclic AMP phosphodiesterase CpdA
MDDFEPFLQIVHISDLHVVDPRSPNAGAIRALNRSLRKIPKLGTWIADGTAPYDRMAVPLFKDFLQEITTDKAWSKCKTWLVDTGDLSSLGDQASLNLGQGYLQEFAELCPEIVSIYGNHDAWPGTLPLVASNAALSAQGQVLAAQQYPVSSPRCALRAAISNGGGEVQLYLVDSVIHERWRNTKALGEVLDPQLVDLKDLVDGNYQEGRYDFRILAVHHPVHYPPPRPHFTMAMSNDNDVAAVLDTPSPIRAYPLAHLVLSGHTHCLYPPHDQLPAQVSLCVHPNLGDDQCQFVVGTLMQLDRYNKRLGWPHQCQVLRLYCSKSKPSILSAERLLAARQGGQAYKGTGIGRYKFVPLPRNSNETAEEISFAL